MRRLPIITSALIFGLPPMVALADPLPAEIIEGITQQITRFATFQQITPDGLVRWSPRTIEPISVIEVPSPTWAGTWLYALRFEVTVLSDRATLVVHATTCEATVVRKDEVFLEPTVFCDPVALDAAASL
jgi:hypothetical protein